MCSEREHLSIGTMVEDFRIDSVIGEGAMAVVYRATQTSLERPVALKILPRELSKDKDYVDRFFNEARAAATLSHANIVQAYDAGIAEGDICYFAMEFVEGESLADRIERDGSIPLTTALRIALDISKALDYGWQRQQLTHGDIKPANILITERGEPKLADFGLAKVRDVEDEDEGIMLTPLYAAPEAIQGQVKPGSSCTDIYSFGATLYHMLTGSPPFPHEDAEEVMRRQVEEALVPARHRNDKIPVQVSACLDHLLEKNPEDRPQDWSEISDQVERLLGDLTRARPVARHSSRPQHKLKTARPVEIYAVEFGNRPKGYLRFGIIFAIAALVVTLIIWITSQVWK